MNELILNGSWGKQLAPEWSAPYAAALRAFVSDAYTTHTVFPAPENVFRAFDACAFEDVRVVILGQDPYHNDGQANGLAFSVSEGVQKPPSLQNIFKEIAADTGKRSVAEIDGDLSRWATQGVLLLNATLTVEAHKAGSHQGMGWEEFTDAVIKKLAEEREGIVFLLWGSSAQKKGAHIDEAKHLVLRSVHPSPLSAYRGFFGCKHFSQANAYLKKREESEIEW